MSLEPTTTFRAGVIAGRVVHNHQDPTQPVSPDALRERALQFARCFNLAEEELPVFFIGVGHGYHEAELLAVQEAAAWRATLRP